MIRLQSDITKYIQQVELFNETIQRSTRSELFLRRRIFTIFLATTSRFVLYDGADYKQLGHQKWRILTVFQDTAFIQHVSWRAILKFSSRIPLRIPGDMLRRIMMIFFGPLVYSSTTREYAWPLFRTLGHVAPQHPYPRIPKNVPRDHSILWDSFIHSVKKKASGFGGPMIKPLSFRFPRNYQW